MSNLELSKFKSVFEYVVIPIMKQVDAEVDSEFKCLTGFHINEIENIYEKCETFYKNKKFELKKIFYGDKFTVETEKDLLFDIHKIASIVCYTLIKHKLFVFDSDAAAKYIKEKNITDTTWIINNAFANYKLAFHVSVAMIYYKLLFDAEEKGCTEIVNSLKKQGGLSLYKVRVEHESFENSVILDFAKRDIHKRSFDYFLYSAFLFQLEEYNKKIFDKEGIL